MDSRRYRAFISYSHTDAKWAEWLFRRIESYRVPRHLVGQTREGRVIPKRLEPLFKDRDELASSADLNASVSSALNQSDALIVICSPRAQVSKWVNEEIRRFKTQHGGDRVFPLIVGSEEGVPFPPALRQTFDADGQLVEEDLEPLAADVRSDGRPNALLKILAGLLGVSFDELKQRELHRRNQRLSWLAAGSVAAVCVLSWLVVRATLAEQEAAFRQAQAEGLVEFMISDLRAKLQPIGRLDVLDAVGQEAMSYLSTIDAEHENARSRSRRGKVLGQLGEIELEQGAVGEALNLFEQALAIQQSAFAMASTPEIRFGLSQASFWLGYGYWEAGDYDAALPLLDAYRDHSLALVAVDPGRLAWQLEAVYAAINLGTIHFEQDRFSTALSEFDSAAQRLEALILEHPDEVNLPATLLQTLAWMGGTQWELGEWQAARRAYVREVAVAEQLVAEDPDDYYRLEELALALQRLGIAVARSGDAAGALRRLERARDLSQALVERERSNFYWRYAEARSNWFLGEAQERIGNWEAAMSLYRAALEAFDQIAADERRAKFAVEHAALLNDLSSLALRSEQAETASNNAVLVEALLADQPMSRAADHTRAEAHLLAACSGSSAGGVDAARVLMARHDAVGRPDFLALRTVVGLVEPGTADDFELEKLSSCGWNHGLPS